MIAIAAPKQLVCSYNNLSDISSEEVIDPAFNQVWTTVLPIGSQIESAADFCSSYGGDYCEEEKKLKAMKEVCLASPELPRYTIIFETSELNTGNIINGEFTFESCGKYGREYKNYYQGDLNKITLSATPSIISVEGVASQKQTFNVDRKTLKAGYGTSRLMSCKVEDVNLLENQI